MLDQNQTPLLDTLKANTTRPHAAFYTPGHKGGQGISPRLVDLFGEAVFRADLTELSELDNLFAPQGVIQQAQQLAAEAFGAAQTWFLVNGSTCGIEAAILATCGMGDKIILPRNVHSSAIAGLILSGAMPIFVNPEYDPILDIAHSITPASVEAALEQHPDAKAVMIVYPTYYGVCADVEAIARITHQYNIPLLVDEAHGAHFAFHPQLPIAALAAGADLSVQSIHKTLGAMTQASMLHVQGDRININRVTKALQLVQSTSPSYILLASLDAARQQMALHGKELMFRTLELADEARTHISQIPGLSVLEISPTNLTPPNPPSLVGKGGILSPSPRRGGVGERFILDKTGKGGILSPSPRRGGVGERFILDKTKTGKGRILSPSPRRGGVGERFTLDKTRLTVTVSGLGLTGFEAEEILDQLGITAEFASLQHLTFIISLGNSAEDIQQLVQGFMTLAQMMSVNKNKQDLRLSKLVWDDFISVDNSVYMSPREAFFAESETRHIEETRECICAEIVCPYPPGIPVLMPGEIITANAIAYLQQILAMGGMISGCADSSLKSLKVVKD
ncbi:aminotransferase class I/II-fold pyridoxal phosphate-dependent enzyme [Scytonema hofmannii FACHB-248]|uniref:Aminotransferase class I/II-fold pyridoxal phosphate-dependent enzyme n=1 Tax=Scytonema hofmannii FACHB-248 TaxID=1842502 RepID=A0ABR8GLH0_9CYAN|nr:MULTISPECIES: aminotransferase class I/II-fold pyridoxal phosphate-dependent enzyme [Nostocales]MBD2604242.1 aminotransferase class I/II-fold pyridoxal phosphate-dependent enzyme [Scytonema hofmannii FACHB-248]